MNYYERHLGDYAKDTGHLSLLEHGVYTILLDRYYSTEAGIPADKAYRLARARTDEEMAAVDCVLEEFFTLEDGTWTHGRCEEVIAQYREGDTDREIKVGNEKERKQRYRDERARLFTDLRDKGVVLDWNTPMDSLRKTHATICSAPGTELERLCDGDGTATHTPVTSNQKPEIKPLDTHTDNPVLAKADDSLTAGCVCVFLTELGILHTNPDHPDLLAALGGGATRSDFAFAATEAANKGKGFAYLLKIVLGNLEKKHHAKHPRPPRKNQGNPRFTAKYAGLTKSGA